MCKIALHTTALQRTELHMILCRSLSALSRIRCIPSPICWHLGFRCWPLVLHARLTCTCAEHIICGEDILLTCACVALVAPCQESGALLRPFVGSSACVVNAKKAPSCTSACDRYCPAASTYFAANRTLVLLCRSHSA